MHPLETLAKTLSLIFHPIGRYWSLERVGRSVVLYFNPDNSPVVQYHHERGGNICRGEGKAVGFLKEAARKVKEKSEIKVCIPCGIC
jgi:hypothetical protein